MKKNKEKKYTGIPLWACLLLSIIFMLAIKAVASNNIVVSITTYKDGVPTTLDSLRINARFYSNATPTVITDTSFIMFPTSFIWDTVLTWDVSTDVEILQNHEFWFGNDVLYIDNKERLRLDSVNFTDNVSFGGGSDTVAIKQLFVNNWTSAGGGLGWALMLGDTTWTISVRTLTQEFVINDTNILGEIIGLMPDNWTAADSAAFQGAASGLSLSDIALIVDSILTANHGIGPWTTGGTGSGPNTVFIYTIDSSAIPDDTLTGISIFVNNLTGSPEASGITNSLGYTTVGLTFDSWLLKAGTNKTTYAFDDTTFTNVTNPDTFSIFGYLNVIASPADPLKSLLFGYVKDVLGNAKSGVIVKLALETTMNVSSTSPGGYTVGDGIAYDTTDVDGFFGFELPRSSTFADTLKSLYNIQGELNKIPQFVVPNINVPDIGNVDITDEINN